VHRGGSWNNTTAINVRAAYRNDNPPTNRNNNIGFRCARARNARVPAAKAVGRVHLLPPPTRVRAIGLKTLRVDDRPAPVRSFPKGPDAPGRGPYFSGARSARVSENSQPESISSLRFLIAFARTA